MVFIKRLIQFFIFLPILLILYINIKLYYSPNYKQEENSTYNTDVLSQLRHLKDEVHNKNAGIRMQQLFPEGFVFTNVLYGLA